jgi:uncharacterized membrane protein (UPF0136 family)
MHRSLGVWLTAYGAFLVAAGVAGYLSNPERAATALASGGTFGGLAIVLGALLRRGRGWARWAGLATASLLSVVFAWRATVSWVAVSAGEPKLFAAGLITAMGLASLATLYVLASAPAGRTARAPGAA